MNGFARRRWAHLDDSRRAPRASCVRNESSLREVDVAARLVHAMKPDLVLVSHATAALFVGVLQGARVSLVQPPPRQTEFYGPETEVDILVPPAAQVLVVAAERHEVRAPDGDAAGAPLPIGSQAGDDAGPVGKERRDVFR